MGFCLAAYGAGKKAADLVVRQIHQGYKGLVAFVVQAG